ncbi:hypothetical protein HAX54_049659, partial [Datura stramonium]|nr:hypothetical protein [Datura stramonium]
MEIMQKNSLVRISACRTHPKYTKSCGKVQTKSRGKGNLRLMVPYHTGMSRTIVVVVNSTRFCTGQ